MAAEYLITTITNNLLKLGFAILGVYFLKTHFMDFLERRKIRQAKKDRMEFYEKIAELDKRGIDLEEAIKKSVTITKAIEKDLDLEKLEVTKPETELIPKAKEVDKFVKKENKPKK